MASRSSSNSMITSSIRTTRRWSYDVFLSFRGEDTRNIFTAYLYRHLIQKGINTFLDDEELRGGEQIAPALLKAIGESRLAIVIFSPNYASSSWCLDELTKIVECAELKGLTLLPVFYHVDPSEVRDQTGGYGAAMEKHERRFADDMAKVQKWRTALVRASSCFHTCWHLNNGHGPELIESIVHEVSERIDRPLLYVAKHPVGIDHHVDELRLLLSIGTPDAYMIGIYGIGGIGKTTIAKATFNLIARSFEGSCFLANVRETSEKYNGIVKLQMTLLSRISGNGSIAVADVSMGMTLINNALCNRRVLLVLDDVSHPSQVEALAGRGNWFGSGSRIVITTRDEHVLIAQEVKKRYKMTELNNSDALELLSWNAFKAPFPPADYKKVSNVVMNYTKGLPLALIIVGSFLSGQSITEWEKTIDRLKLIPDVKIFDLLKISFDGLEDSERAIFLDIACFFKGKKKDHVMEMLNDCKLYPVIGFAVLLDKSLIHIEYNELQMHDLIQQVGRDIVRQESSNPGKRSRLWFHEDVIHVLEENTGTDTVEGILIDMPNTEVIHLHAKCFANLTSLRLFIVNNARFSNVPDYLPNGIRWLEWSGYPSTSMPSNFRPKNLIVLKLDLSCIRQLHHGLKRASNLTILELTECHSLREVPDVSAVPNLKELIIMDCRRLEKIHKSVGFLDKLVRLDLVDCSELRRLPNQLGLKSLQTIQLNGCSRLEMFPEILGSMEHVEQVDISDTAIIELPSSIRNLTGLVILTISKCNSLKAIPGSIYNLQNMKEILITDCPRLCQFPTKQEDMFETDGSIKNPNSDTSISTGQIGFNLEGLSLQNCGISNLDFLEASDCFSSLVSLYLSRNNFLNLPSSIAQFADLNTLSLDNCSQLTEIAELPPNITYLVLASCKSLERIQTRILRSEADIEVDLANCHKLGQNQVADELLHEAFFGDSRFGVLTPGGAIPSWFYHKGVGTQLHFFRKKRNPSFGSTGHSLRFKVHSCMRKKMVGFAVAIAFDLRHKATNLNCLLSINGEELDSYEICFGPLESDHVWLGYFPIAEQLKETVEMGWTEMEVSFYESRIWKDIDAAAPDEPVKLKGFGANFIGKKGENVNKSTGIRFIRPKRSRNFREEANEDGNLQLRKRRRRMPSAGDTFEPPLLEKKKHHCSQQKRWLVGTGIGLGLKLRPFNITMNKIREVSIDRDRQ